MRTARGLMVTEASAYVAAPLAAAAALHHCSRLGQAEHTHNTLENVVALLQSLEPHGNIRIMKSVNWERDRGGRTYT